MTITAIPPLDRTSPSFRAEVDTMFSTRIPTLTVELNALASDLTIKQGLASAAATAANNDKIATAGIKDTAQLAADAAESYRTQAQSSAAAAAASAQTIGITAAFSDANPVVKGSADITKQLKFEIDGFTAATTRTVTIPNKNGTMAMLEDSGLGFLGEVVLVTATANIDFLSIFNGGIYDRFLITIQNANSTTSGSEFLIRYAIAGVVDSTASYNASAYGSVLGSTTTALALGTPSAGNPMQSEFTLYNNDIGNSKRSHVCSPSGNFGEILRGFHYKATPVALSGFRIYVANGTDLIAGTTVRVYGFKKA
ncbi:hypothetical protein F2P45_31795 [Massilia sp. CCM 8733]|uniref:Tail fiber protein n=1 Tax=Massilia mucilaginosa TaxID=2609282 RepID=A0ABX0P494_9BURK|nr:hypothetical protein [Massilia mucilaginosa]NHZ93551.1 hypothetical protein [Massilia mucilaginosa]